MGKTFEGIDHKLAGWIAAQKVFFVATAPLAADGHLNLSPKGLDTFAVLDRTTVAYLDLTGSGVETIAHLRENGRIAIMFCAFEGPPRIVRLHGRGRVLAPDHDVASCFPAYEGVRSFVSVDVDRISDSCGFGVPRMRYERDRDELPAWARRKGAPGLAAYRAEKNARSIDGLPGVSESGVSVGSAHDRG